MNKRISRLERSLDERGERVDELENKFRLLREKRDLAARDRELEAGYFTPPPGLKVIKLGEKSTLRIKGPPDTQGGHADKEAHTDNKNNHSVEVKKIPAEKGPGTHLVLPLPSSSSAALPSAEAMYKKARKLFLSGKFSEARTIFMNLTTAYPESGLADNAFYWSAEGYYRKKNFKAAIVHYTMVVERYPRGNKAADALFGLGVSYVKLGDKTGAGAAWERIVRDYPDSEAAVSALKRLKLL